MLGVNLENLILTGPAAINGVGNTTANTITGNNANNLINGGGGVDHMVGGAGNDTYVTNGGDTITEGVNRGTDKVLSSASFTLRANLENLTLTGAANISGIGNLLKNTIVGGTGANTLKGGLGNDTLSGGAGNDKLYGEAGKDNMTGGRGKDIFAYTTALNKATNVDRIVDFSHRDDTIQLGHLFFKGMGLGPLKSQYFFAGAHANDADDRIIYNKATGALYYDSDGTGAHAQVLFAVVTNHAHAGLASDDFALI